MIKNTLIACTLVLGVMVEAQASGTYLPPTGRVPAKKGSSMDSAVYALGQKTFEGKMMSPGAGKASTQKAKLAAIQSKAPAGTDLTSLAGKITDEQLSALEYYVCKRFGM